MEQKEWFVDWFDSEYYHILYQNRNDNEAQLFMRNLIEFLHLKKNSYILDLACGKGRHSVFLNSLGYKVNGVDLAKNSIDYANKFKNKNLHFFVHDMRLPFKHQYDAIFNLFTSFGYFNDDETNINVLKNIKNGLLKNGVAVIDFMNIETVSKNLIKSEVKIKNNIEFHITREIRDQKIIKTIDFTADNKHFKFTEEVQCLTFETIKNYILKAKLQLMHIFGDYHLNEFDMENSDRLILIVKNTN